MVYRLPATLCNSLHVNAIPYVITPIMYTLATPHRIGSQHLAISIFFLESGLGAAIVELFGDAIIEFRNSLRNTYIGLSRGLPRVAGVKVPSFGCRLFSTAFRGALRTSSPNGLISYTSGKFRYHKRNGRPFPNKVTASCFQSYREYRATCRCFVFLGSW